MARPKVKHGMQESCWTPLNQMHHECSTIARCLGACAVMLTCWQLLKQCKFMLLTQMKNVRLTAIWANLPSQWDATMQMAVVISSAALQSSRSNLGKAGLRRHSCRSCPVVVTGGACHASCQQEHSLQQPFTGPEQPHPFFAEYLANLWPSAPHIRHSCCAPPT